MKCVTLIGMPGSGKSTIGVLLAKRLGLDFVDTDLLIQSREGAPLQDVLDRRGVEAFLELEAEVLCSLSFPDGAVVAPGGSCVAHKRAMEHLKQLGPVVYIKLPYEAIGPRISNLDTRGIAFRPGQTLRDLYDQRTPLYEIYADITVETEGLSLEQSAAAILNVLLP